MLRRSIVRVDDMATGASASPIVARLIVRPRKREQGIEQPRLLESEEHRIRPQFRAESPIAQLVLRPARLLVTRRVADLALGPTAALEHAEHVARLRHFPPRQRIE